VRGAIVMAVAADVVAPGAVVMPMPVTAVVVVVVVAVAGPAGHEVDQLAEVVRDDRQRALRKRADRRVGAADRCLQVERERLLVGEQLRLQPGGVEAAAAERREPVDDRLLLWRQAGRTVTPSLAATAAPCCSSLVWSVTNIAPRSPT
jgi:hypothetical protein